MSDDFDPKTIHGYVDNPRDITPKQFQDLEKNMRRLGDLGVITITRDGLIIAGHRRNDVVSLKDTEINWFIELETPLKSGTVKFGTFIFDGEVWGIRMVDWEDEDHILLGNLASNKNGGYFDYDKLLNFDAEILKEAGFEQEELDGLFSSAESDFEDATELEEESESLLEENGSAIQIFLPEDDATRDYLKMCVKDMLDQDFPDIRYKIP